MSINLGPPAGDSKTPPQDLTTWGKLFSWLYLLWQWVTRQAAFGGDVTSYSEAVLVTAQSDAANVPIRFHGPPPVVMAQNSSAQSIPFNSFTTVTNWTEVADNVGCFNATSGTWTCPRTGLYTLSASAMFASVAATVSSLAAIQFLRNGTNAFAENILNTENATASIHPTGTVCLTLGFIAGETIVVQVYQNFVASNNQLLQANANLTYLNISFVGDFV